MFLSSSTTNVAVHYRFDGYTTEMVSHKAKNLGDAGLVKVNTPLDWSQDQLRYWPTGFDRRGGINFLAAEKDERTWTEALETLNAQGGTHTLKALKAIILKKCRCAGYASEVGVKAGRHLNAESNHLVPRSIPSSAPWNSFEFHPSTVFAPQGT